jgi:aminoglycoside phosphotransferase (APT) family kinase protein
MIEIDTVDGKTRPAVAQIVNRGDTELWMLPVADEGAVVVAAGNAGVPVAEVLAADHSRDLDADVLITARVSGETIPRRVLRSLGADVDGGLSLTRSCGRALARLHRMDPPPVDGLTRPLGVLAPAAYIDHLTERLDALPHPLPTFRLGIGLLASCLPESPAEPAVVHGDFRNGNLIVADHEVRAVVDWELAHLGDPMEDLAWLCLRTWRFDHDHRPVGGFGRLSWLQAAYEEAGGEWRQEAFDWWTMARTIWWGIGLASQAVRFVEEHEPGFVGERSTSIVHAASGRRVVELEYDLLRLLRPLLT